MAFTPTPVPAFPDVPNALGVPPVARSASQVIDDIALLTADAVIISRMLQGPQWGIFDANMQPVIVGDSTVRMSFAKDFRISDYPVEGGGFESYDKVETPYDARLTFAIGGSFTLGTALSAINSTSLSGAVSALTGEAARAAFLSSMSVFAASTALFNVVTPDMVYPNANIVHYDYERTDRNGATMLMVDVDLQEVRVAPAPQFSNTQQPSGADPVNGGTVQTVPVASQPLAAPSAPNSLTTFQFS